MKNPGNVNAGRQLPTSYGRYGAKVYVIDLATGKVSHRIKTGPSPHVIVLIDLIIPQ
ncbi:MAG: hypothetical protein O6948_08840 [Deltaproteobacteria bacterium]|nr:hypothetical protein [Deltaproteobacteria bacterium]